MLKRLMVFFIVVVSAGSLRAQAGGGFAELGGSHLTFQFRSLGIELADGRQTASNERCRDKKARLY